jgi:hypothetical protein
VYGIGVRFVAVISEQRQDRGPDSVAVGALVDGQVDPAADIGAVEDGGGEDTGEAFQLGA